MIVAITLSCTLYTNLNAYFTFYRSYETFEEITPEDKDGSSILLAKQETSESMASLRISPDANPEISGSSLRKSTNNKTELFESTAPLPESADSSERLPVMSPWKSADSAEFGSQIRLDVSKFSTSPRAGSKQDVSLPYNRIKSSTSLVKSLDTELGSHVAVKPNRPTSEDVCSAGPSKRLYMYLCVAQQTTPRLAAIILPETQLSSVSQPHPCILVHICKDDACS